MVVLLADPWCLTTGIIAVAARKDVALWKRFMPPLPRLLGGLFAGLLMVHLFIPNQVVSSNELICSSVLDLQCGLAHRRGNAGGRSLSPYTYGGSGGFTKPQNTKPIGRHALCYGMPGWDS